MGGDDSISLDLNQVVMDEQPEKEKALSSPTKQSKGKGSSFHLEVDQVEPVRNLPTSIRLGSFSALEEDSTLQLETVIAPIKPISKIPFMSKEQNNDNPKVILQQFKQDDSVTTPYSLKQNFFKAGKIEEKTEDKGVRLTIQRDDGLFSEDENISNRMRPESPRKLNNQYKIEETRKSSTIKPVILVLTLMTLVFGVCMDVYYMLSMSGEGLEFILVGLAAAFVSDVALQLLILIVLSACQLSYEIKGKQLPLETTKLRLMTAQTRELAKKVFVEYIEQGQLLTVDYLDQTDLLIQKLEQQDLEKQSGQSDSVVSG